MKPYISLIFIINLIHLPVMAKEGRFYGFMEQLQPDTRAFLDCLLSDLGGSDSGGGQPSIPLKLPGPLEMEPFMLPKAEVDIHAFYKHAKERLKGFLDVGSGGVRKGSNPTKDFKSYSFDWLRCEDEFRIPYEAYEQLSSFLNNELIRALNEGDYRKSEDVLKLLERINFEVEI